MEKDNTLDIVCMGMFNLLSESVTWSVLNSWPESGGLKSNVFCIVVISWIAELRETRRRRNNRNQPLLFWQLDTYKKKKKSLTCSQML